MDLLHEADPLWYNIGISMHMIVQVTGTHCDLPGEASLKRVTFLKDLPELYILWEVYFLWPIQITRDKRANKNDPKANNTINTSYIFNRQHPLYIDRVGQSSSGACNPQYSIKYHKYANKCSGMCLTTIFCRDLYPISVFKCLILWHEANYILLAA